MGRGMSLLYLVLLERQVRMKIMLEKDVYHGYY